MEKREFTEFLKNEKFIRWVINPTPESDHFWKNWITSHPQRKGDIELARNFISSVEYRNQFRLADQKYKSGLYNLMELHEAEINKRRINYAVVWRAVGVAAMLLLAVFIGLHVQQVSDITVETPIAKNVTKQTEFGQKKIIRLPDGTTVHLNAGSALSFLEPFEPNARKVLLSGEAFFEVARDEAKPFIIQTGNLSTRVLGTSFNVRAYPDEQNISVSVETGKVQVYTAKTQKEVVLNPDEQAVYYDETQPIEVSLFDKQAVMGWRDGIIQFSELPLSKVITTLERIYGVEFIIANPNIQLREAYSGVYKNAPLERILKGISFAAGFSYELEGKTVTIKSNKMNE